MGGIRRQRPRRAALPFGRHRRDSRDGQRHGGRRGPAAGERRLRHDRPGGRRGGPAHSAACGRPDALGRAPGHRRGRTNVRRQGFRGGTDHGEGSVSIEADRQRAALHRIAADDPELAARLVLMTLPAAAAHISGTLAFQLEIDQLGSYRCRCRAAARGWTRSQDGGRHRLPAPDGRPHAHRPRHGHGRPARPDDARQAADTRQAPASTEAPADVLGRSEHWPRSWSRAARSIPTSFTAPSVPHRSATGRRDTTSR